MRHDVTIFDGAIINKNSFTALLKNFLRFQPFRQAFLNLIDIEFDKASVETDNFDTQLSISQFGGPDIALTTDKAEILFDLKVYDTDLSTHQLAEYYHYLRTNRKVMNKALVFIIPEHDDERENYLAMLEGIKSKKDSIHTQIISWKTIAGVITENGLDRLSPLFYEYVKFITYWFQLEPTYFDSLNTTTMFGTNFPDSLEKTMLIIDNIYKEFQKRGFSMRWTRAKHFAEYGFYLQLPDDESLFFGIWFDYWKSTGNPVCISLKSKTQHQQKAFSSVIKRNHLHAAQAFEGYPTTFICDRVLMDEQCEQNISNSLAGIMAEIQNTRNLSKVTVKKRKAPIANGV